MTLTPEIIKAACEAQVVITKPQLALALDLYSKGLLYVAEYYPPGRKLVAEGYAVRVGDKLRLTPEGKKLIETLIERARA